MMVARVVGSGRPADDPKAVLRVMLATARRCGCNFETAWYMAVPVALTNMDEDSARFAAAEFESEREQLETRYCARGVTDPSHAVSGVRRS